MATTLRLLIAAGLVVGTTCADPTSPSTGGIRTDSNAYTATAIKDGQVSIRLVVSYTNPADTAVGLDHCAPGQSYPSYFVSLVAPANPEGAAYNPVWACVGGVSPLVVAPKATRIDTITLRGPTEYDETAGRYLGVIAGTFRIVYGGQGSNPFTISPPPDGVIP